jgi:hypothetical protein
MGAAPTCLVCGIRATGTRRPERPLCKWCLRREVTPTVAEGMAQTPRLEEEAEAKRIVHDLRGNWRRTARSRP